MRWATEFGGVKFSDSGFFSLDDFLYKNGAAAIFGPGTVIPVAAEKMLEELFKRI